MTDRKKPIACVYLIRRIDTGDCYVGSTSNQNARWYAHTNALQKGKHHAPHLQNAWSKYGKDCFEFVVLEICAGSDLKSILKEREDHWMNKLNPKYNVLAAAYSALGFKHPRESVERRAAMRRGVKRPDDVVERMAAGHRGMKMPRDAVERTAAANRGRKMLDHTKAAIVAALTGKKKSAEHVEKMRLARIGFKHNDEAKEKNRISSTGRVKSPETIAKHKELKHTDEVKARISAKNKGLKRSPECIAKMRERKPPPGHIEKMNEARRLKRLSRILEPEVFADGV